MKKIEESAFNKKIRKNIVEHQKSGNPFKTSKNARKMLPMNINGTMYLLCPDTGEQREVPKRFIPKT